jgi:hypothetical protein
MKKSKSLKSFPDMSGNGLKKVPTEVRNNMGLMARGVS